VVWAVMTAMYGCLVYVVKLHAAVRWCETPVTRLPGPKPGLVSSTGKIQFDSSHSVSPFNMLSATTWPQLRS